MKKRLLSILMVLCLAVSLVTPVVAVGGTSADLQEGVNVLLESATNMTYVVDEGKALAIPGGTEEKPLVFTNCEFLISEDTMAIDGSGVGYTGETRTKIGIGSYVTFENCTFQATNGSCRFTEYTNPETGAQSWRISGNDACITFFGPGVTFTGGTITANNWVGQFLGLYGSNTDSSISANANVAFSGTEVSTVGNTGGWSYAMYAHSVLCLDGATLTATGMQRYTAPFEDGTLVTGGNVNAFYSGDARTGYDAITIKNQSNIDFSDNSGGGFAINNVNIHVNDSTINVSNNLGNACNSG